MARSSRQIGGTQVVINIVFALAATVVLCYTAYATYSVNKPAAGNSTIPDGSDPIENGDSDSVLDVVAQFPIDSIVQMVLLLVAALMLLIPSFVFGLQALPIFGSLSVVIGGVLVALNLYSVVSDIIDKFKELVSAGPEDLFEELKDELEELSAMEFGFTLPVSNAFELSTATVVCALVLLVCSFIQEFSSKKRGCCSSFIFCVSNCLVFIYLSTVLSVVLPEIFDGPYFAYEETNPFGIYVRMAVVLLAIVSSIEPARTSTIGLLMQFVIIAGNIAFAALYLFGILGPSALDDMAVFVAVTVLLHGIFGILMIPIFLLNWISCCASCCCGQSKSD